MRFICNPFMSLCPCRKARAAMKVVRTWLRMVSILHWVESWHQHISLTCRRLLASTICLQGTTGIKPLVKENLWRSRWIQAGLATFPNPLQQEGPSREADGMQAIYLPAPPRVSRGSLGLGAALVVPGWPPGWGLGGPVGVPGLPGQPLQPTPIQFSRMPPPIKLLV